MRISAAQATQALVIVVFVLLLGLPIGLYFLISRGSIVPSGGTVVPSPQPEPRKDPSLGKVLKSSTSAVVHYWIYGRVISVGTENSIGIPVSFILDGDPLQTRLDIVLMADEGKYKVYWYDQDFQGGLKLQLVERETVIGKVLEAGGTLEFRIPFLRNPGPQEAAVASALESPNSGNWQNLPKTTLNAEIVGIVGQP